MRALLVLSLALAGCGGAHRSFSAPTIAPVTADGADVAWFVMTEERSSGAPEVSILRCAEIDDDGAVRCVRARVEAAPRGE